MDYLSRLLAAWLLVLTADLLALVVRLWWWGTAGKRVTFIQAESREAIMHLREPTLSTLPEAFYLDPN